jgi:hypothetical protein
MRFGCGRRPCCVLCGDPGLGLVVPFVTTMKCCTFGAKQTEFQPGTWAGRVDCAKQSQTWEGWSIWERASRAAWLRQRVERAKQSQSGGARLRPGGRLCETNPIRQPMYPSIPPFHHSNIPVPCLSCETKPIPADAKKRQVPGGERVMVYWPREQPRQNKANFQAWSFVRNKANFGAIAGPKGQRYKQSQLAGWPIVQNEPNSRRMKGRVQWAA